MVITTYLNNISIDEKGKFEGVALSLFQVSQINHEEINRNLESILSSTEMSYYNRLYRNKKRQEEMYCGRLAAKKLVSESLGYRGRLKDIELIKINDKEKPKLFVEKRKIHKDLSIAHNDQYAVATYSFIGKVGVDIESCNLKLDESFIKYAFSKEEIDFWSKYKMKYKNIWVLLWTIKEAIGKALAIGLSLGMDFIKILMDEERCKLYIAFKEEKIINNLICGKKIKLYYSVKDDNYISICHLWKV
jgi:phosphopantetheinyl transferase